jgi:uncharacterized RDD family membrane protein YckC
MKSIPAFFRWPALVLTGTAVLLAGAPLAAQETSAPVAPSAPAAPQIEPASNVPPPPVGRGFVGNYRDAIQFGGSVVVEQGEVADEVVAIGGSVQVEGEARRGIVAIGGDATVTGPAGDNVVAIFGNVTAAKRVRGDIVAILGSARAEDVVNGDMVAIMGDIQLGPKAVVNGDVVSIGGTITRAPGAVVRGNIQAVGVGGTMNFTKYQGWIRECLLLGRPLAFSGNVAGAWVVAAGFLLLYLVFALTASNSVEKCLVTLRERPGRAVLATLLALVLTPIVLVLVAVTGVGLVVMPLLLLGLLGAGMFGRAVLLAWLGRGLLRPFNGTPGASLVVSVALGGVLVALMYTIPIFGFLLWKLLGAFGFGVVVYTIILGMKRDRPAPPPRVYAAAPANPFTAQEPPPAFGLVPVAADTPPPAPAPLPPATTWPRVGFWRRFFALAIDALLIGILVGPLTKGVLVLPGLAIYAACLWRARGTTIGGIIFGLKVVRLDDRPVDWTTAIVRALACFISLGVVFLGFIWVAFDAEKQSWHDKIAGTIVVRAPRGMSLI